MIAFYLYLVVMVVAPILCLLVASTTFQALSSLYSPSLSSKIKNHEVKSLISYYKLKLCSTIYVASMETSQ